MPPGHPPEKEVFTISRSAGLGNRLGLSDESCQVAD